MKQTAALILDFHTPKRIEQTGFWFGPKNPETAIVMVHGLGGSALSGIEKALARHLVDNSTGVLLFNNRGYGVINKVYKDAPKTKKGYKRFYAGAAHEVFTDCPDDIQGAINAAKKMGATRVFLAGHSTGCQKSIYWAKKAAKKRSAVDGIILLAPISDYSFALKVNTGELEKTTRIAKKMVAAGKKHDLLPQSVWPRTEDAQRFLSLYTPDSQEEIFTYAQPKKIPRVLRSIEIPILAVFAQHDEFLDRPADALANWFTRQIYSGEAVVIRNTMHSFQKKEKEVAQLMVRFMKERYN